MSKFAKIFVLAALSLLFISCSSGTDKRLKISATTWIGYTPLFYAKESGWLEPLNIKLLNVSSLSENMYLYKAGNVDAYVGTQYEYGILSKENASLIPIMLFDRSYGGDVIMSNLPIDGIRAASGPLDVYLEMDSINRMLFDDFVKKYGLEDKEINYINMDQSQISTIKNISTDKATVIVTYSPYDKQLEKKGFKTVVSTSDGLELLVLDALFATTEVFHEHSRQFKELKKIVDRAVVQLRKDPKEYYEKVKPYMLEIDYDEFLDSLKHIIWVNKNIPDDLKERIKEINLPIRDVL